VRLLVAERGGEAYWGAGRWLVEGEGGRGKGGVWHKGTLPLQPLGVGGGVS
jgi:hypothetical protein